MTDADAETNDIKGTEITLTSDASGEASFEHMFGKKPVQVITNSLDDIFTKNGDVISVVYGPYAFQVTAFDDTNVSGTIYNRSDGSPAANATLHINYLGVWH